MLASGRHRRAPLAWVLIGAVLAPAPRALPQDAVEALGESWRWRVFDSREGLGSSSISALHQDRHEYIYAATERGICRYDLWEWSVLENAQPFDDGDVKRFVESQGALYAASANVLWKVQGGNALTSAYRGGGLHAASNDIGDVFLIDERAEKHLEVRGEAVERLDDVRLPAGKVIAYDVDPSRVHWLSTSDGLFSRDLARRAWREVQDRDMDTALAGQRCMRFFRVASPPRREGAPDALQDASAKWELWATFRDPRNASAAQSLARLNAGTWMLAARVEGPLLGQVVFDSALGYIATADDGRLLSSPDGREWKNVTSIGLGKTALYGGLLDSANVLWFRSGAGGVAAFDARSRRWESIASGLGESFPNVLSIAETTDGDVWMGTTKGVSRARPGKKPDAWERVQNTALEKVTGLAEDGLGRVWVSSAESFSGAFYFDTDSETWVKEGRDGFKDHPIRRIVRDRAGEVWFLSKETSPRGGYVIYHASLETSYDPVSIRVANGPVNDIARSRDDVLWLATDDGLLQGTIVEDELVLEKRYTNRDGLLSIQVWAVAEGPDGAIWVCYPSSAGGVTRFKDGAARSFQESDGLASPEVWSITAAGPSLWFGTGRGVSRFDGECWYSYPVASLDFRSIRVWPIFASRREADSMLIGTFGQGALRFRTDDHGRPRFVAGAPMPAHAPADGNVTFEWDARDLRSQTPHDSLLYRSRVDGGAWTRFSGARSRELKELSPGKHTFEVEVRDLEGNRNREELVHRFDVGAATSRDVLLIVAGAGGVLLTAALAVVVAARRIRARRRSGRYRGFFRQFPGTVFFVDAEGRVIEWNGAAPAAAGLDGARREDLVGRPLQLIPAFFSEEVRAALKALLRGEELEIDRLRIHGGAGAVRVLDLRGFPLRKSGGKVTGAVVIVADRTREAEEEQLAERERRLWSLRQLAGRLSSDFGDAVRAALEEAPVRSDSKLLERLRHADSMSRKLSAFAGGGAASGGAPSVEVGRILERLLGEGGGGRPDERLHRAPGLKLDYRGPTGLWSAAVEEPLLEDALREVMRNAIDAMPQKGTLTIRAQNVRIDSDPGRLEPGSYLEILVKDTGGGIDPNQMQRIFEPFFSTKPREHALGIGLSIAYGIVRAAGGDIRIESAPGQGTSVRIIVRASREK